MDRNFHNTFRKKLDLSPTSWEKFSVPMHFTITKSRLPIREDFCFDLPTTHNSAVSNIFEPSKSSDSFQNSSVVGAQPPPCCSCARHVVEKICHPWSSIAHLLIAKHNPVHIVSLLARSCLIPRTVFIFNLLPWSILSYIFTMVQHHLARRIKSMDFSGSGEGSVLLPNWQYTPLIYQVSIAF